MMAETKSPLHSRTIWSGVVAILSGLPDLISAGLFLAGLSNEPIAPERLGAALLAVLGGVGAIWGRIAATDRIERHTL